MHIPNEFFGAEKYLLKRIFLSSAMRNSGSIGTHELYARSWLIPVSKFHAITKRLGALSLARLGLESSNILVLDESIWVAL